MTRVPPRDGILEITPYRPGESRIEGRDTVIKLASNEAALGPSPKAIEAAQAAAARLHVYPDPQVSRLRAALSKRHDFEPARLAFSAGSEYLLDLLFRCYAGAGDEILFPELSFPLYRILAHAAGATPVEARAPDFTASVDELLARVSERTRVVCIANPNNPTGTWVARNDLARLRDGLRDDILLIIDSAYGEYPESDTYSAGADVVRANPHNTIMVRTFSKLYALASARIGWGYGGEEIISTISRVRLPFCVTTVAEAAACAALEDEAHIRAELEHCRAWIPRLNAHLRAHGFTPVASAGNFVFFPVPDHMGGWEALDAHLRARGIIARAIVPANALRVTIGRDADNIAFMEAIAAFAITETRATAARL